MSDTPRTDAAELTEPYEIRTLGFCVVNIDFARQLERELAEALDKLSDWENAALHVDSDHPNEVHCGCVAILRKQLNEARTGWEYAAKIAQEIGVQRDALAESLDKCLDRVEHHTMHGVSTGISTQMDIYAMHVARKALAAVKGEKP
jgi:hypothetical protein